MLYLLLLVKSEYTAANEIRPMIVLTVDVGCLYLTALLSARMSIVIFGILHLTTRT